MDKARITTALKAITDTLDHVQEKHIDGDEDYMQAVYEMASALASLSQVADLFLEVDCVEHYGRDYVDNWIALREARSAGAQGYN